MSIPRPLRRLAASEKDQRTLRQILESRTVLQAAQPQDYRDKVVRKPWGYEFLVFENAWVAVWFLHIRKDHSTSMHCHPHKRTALSILSGKALCNTFHQRHFLSPGDALNLDAEVFHSTKAMSLDGVLLMELESPNNKSDLVRLEDSYGRQVSGYEGISEMSLSNLEDFHHFSFQPGGQPWSVEGEAFTFENRFSIGFEGWADRESFQKGFSPDPGALYNVCVGEILSADGERVARIGEVERGSTLCLLPGLATNGPLLLLKIRMFC